MLLALWSGFWDWAGSSPEPYNSYLGGTFHNYNPRKHAIKAKSIVEQVIEAYEREQDISLLASKIVKIEQLAPEAPKLHLEQPIVPQLLSMEVYLTRYIDFLIQQEEEEFVLLAALV